MLKVLKFLYKQKEEGDIYQFHMQEPVSKKDILNLEDYFDGVLPVQYRAFLEYHDGGYICNGHLGEYIWETGNEDLPRERSICLYSAREVLENISLTETIAKTLDNKSFAPFKTIPVAEALYGKIVIMKTEEQSPVFMFSEENDKWIATKLYDDFKSFFHEYIENEGYIKELF